MSTIKTQKFAVWVIGYNQYGELGVNHKERVNVLTLSNISTHNANAVHTGRCYSIYALDRKFWVIGKNTHGQCAIGHQIAEIMEPIEMDYFSRNNINISKICVSCSGFYNTFWITDKGQLYGNGSNGDFSLGLNNVAESTTVWTPQRIPDIMHVLDVQSGIRCSVALLYCSRKSDIIIIYWCRQIGIMIPMDIINEIVTFYYLQYTVYSTGSSIYGHHGQCKEHPIRWTPIEAFKHKNIDKICVGGYQSLFLEDNGILWSCGANNAGQTGQEEMDTTQMEPKPIGYFVSSKIKIKSMKSGDGHSLVIDDNNRVYSFGMNKFGQCGDGTTQPVRTPKLVITLKDYAMIEIDCGAAHSYGKTNCGKHFLWGDNSDNECLVFSGKCKITEPLCINNVMEEFGNGTLIKQISLGYDNTKIILLCVERERTWKCVNCGLINNTKRIQCQACFTDKL